MSELSVLKRIKKPNIENLEEKLKRLSSKERKYFNIMRSQSGVLFITAKPGVGKSAIARSIAHKMGFNYKDVRLSMVDETDVGLFPDVNEITLPSGVKLKVLDHVVPKWAHKANEAPTLIHFEELNRAPQAVRNAALQLLLEREIGTEFAFNDNVFMMASGNLGDEDETDVEEFDRALNNRLIHIKHDLEADEWIKYFAKENVHPDIVDYIRVHKHKLYVAPNDNSTAHASPRSWTFLSDYILNNYGSVASEEYESDGKIHTRQYVKWGDSLSYIDDVEALGHGYIGNEIVPFLKFINNRIQINIAHIINDFDNVKEEVDNWRKNNRRDRYSEMLIDLRTIDLTELNKIKTQNVINFLKLCSVDERISYLTEIVDDYKIDIDHPNYERLFLNFSEDLESMDDINKGEADK